jgi:hypothetical protein
MGRNDIRYLREHLAAAGVSLSVYDARATAVDGHE